MMSGQETAPLLAQDPSIWCVSSWNDNGQAALEWDRQKLVCLLHLSGSHTLCDSIPLVDVTFVKEGRCVHCSPLPAKGRLVNVLWACSIALPTSLGWGG